MTATVDALSKTAHTYFDANGQVTATVDANAHTSFTLYDAVGQTTASVDANGHTSFTIYDAIGQVTASVDALGKTSFMDYDAAGRMTAMVDANGKTSFTSYDANGQATASIDANGHTSFTFYDGVGQVTASVDANGKTSFIDYDADWRATAMVDANGHTSFMLYDALGQPTATVDANGHTSFTFYDGVGQITATVDALGKTSYTDFDANGRVTAMVDATGKTSFTLYDAVGQATATVDANGVTSFQQYDAVGNVTVSIDGNGHTTQNSYDADNRLTQFIDNLGRTASMAYDANGQLTQSVDVHGFTTLQSYDAVGNTTEVFDAAGFASYTNYDAANRPTSSIDGNGHTSKQLYDADGRVTSNVDGNGFTSLTKYDAIGQVTATVDGAGNTTQFLYDAAGNRTAVIDPDANTTTMAYDAMDQLTQTVSTSAGTTTQSYDAVGNLTQTIQADGGSIVYSYDADNRQTQQVWYDPSHATVDTQHKTYDDVGRLLTASNNNGTYSFSYDNDGQATQVAEPFGVTLHYAYDGIGNQTQVIDSFGGTQTSVYDLENRLTTREYSGQGEELRVDYTYSPMDEIETETRYSDLAGTALVGSTVYAYDGDEQTTSILSYDSTSAIIENYSYTYDPAGNLATQTENGDYSYFNYDGANQLTLVGFLPSGSMTYVYSNYGYDAAGNRNTGGSTPTTGNQLTTDGTWDYTYDPKGNLIEKDSVSTSEKWTYAFNNANELTEVKHFNTSGVLAETVDYKYDVFGEEIERDVTPTGSGTTTTKFAVNGWNPALPAPIGNENFSTWAVLNAANVLQTREIFGDQVDQALARIDQTGASDPSGVYFTLSDRQGSVRDVADSSGTVVDTIAYDGFGNIKAGELDPTYRGWYAYTGRAFDNEIKLQNNHARWYDATAGRWISQDPLGFDAGDSNLYRYVNNRPTVGADPSGLSSLVIDSFGGVYYQPFFGNRVYIGLKRGNHVLRGLDYAKLSDVQAAANAYFGSMPNWNQFFEQHKSGTIELPKSDGPSNPFKAIDSALPPPGVIPVPPSSLSKNQPTQDDLPYSKPKEYIPLVRVRCIACHNPIVMSQEGLTGSVSDLPLNYQIAAMQWYGVSSPGAVDRHNSLIQKFPTVRFTRGGAEAAYDTAKMYPAVIGTVQLMVSPIQTVEGIVEKAENDPFYLAGAVLTQVAITKTVGFATSGKMGAPSPSQLTSGSSALSQPGLAYILEPRVGGGATWQGLVIMPGETTPVRLMGGPLATPGAALVPLTPGTTALVPLTTGATGLAPTTSGMATAMSMSRPTIALIFEPRVGGGSAWQGLVRMPGETTPVRIMGGPVASSGTALVPFAPRITSLVPATTGGTGLVPTTPGVTALLPPPANPGMAYLGPYYGQARSLFQRDPAFFPNPDTTPFRIVTGDALAAERALFTDSGLLGHHVHPLMHGGPGLPGPGGLTFTGEARITRSGLLGADPGLDLTFYRQYGNPNARVLWIFQDEPGGIFQFGRNPRHTVATDFWNSVGRWQRQTGVRE
ncbi:MAG TPA: RHS repeat-associated core domain-containing protein [Gemmataceae bacterium]|nr:RHS repeat-associated core domain-containing protein [Gemmataceae bacterium]